ncbi:hypothetical protein BJV78DRAFT_1188986 [Lactifluus subvellereus]|nr:hypothetical protein BJV78DRAFT_1188986 [Lactifluus subvellereus]
MTVSSLAARSRFSLVRAGSLTEAKLTANASRRSQRPPAPRQDSCDSTSSVGPVAGNGSSVPGTPPRERHDSYHHHRASHSLTGSPLPQEFPRQRYESTNSGGSRSSSRAESRSSIADFRDRMKDTEKERQHERERAWNRPVSARPRAISHTSPAGHPASPGSSQLRSTPDRAPHSRGHSRPSSPSGSVRSRAAEEEEENYERERDWESPRPTWHHQNSQPASPIPGPSSSRPRAQSTHTHIAELHVHTQAQGRHVRRNPSQSSLHSESSSRPSSPADPAHKRQTTRDDEVGANHERERNWGSRQQTWNHTRVHNRAASPNPVISHSRVRTQSLESDSSAPATSTLTRLPNGPLKRRPNEPSSPAPAELPLPRHTALSPEAHQYLKHNGTSSHPMSTSPRPKLANGYAHDKPGRVPSRLPRPDSPLAPSNVNGNVEGNGVPPAPAPAPHFGWQFPRNRPKLPDFEPDLSSSERSPSPVHRSTSHLVGSAKPSYIPVRSPGQVPKVAIKRNGDAKSFAKGHKRATTEFAEANGAVPPKIHFLPEPEPEPEFTSEPGNPDTESLRESDESMQDALTPVVRPIEIPPPETLPSTPPVENPFAHPAHAPSASDGEDSETSTHSAAPPLDTAPSFELSTPPRRSSFSTSKIEFQTPSPPKGLPELPGPPSSSEDDTGDIDILSTHRNSDGPLNLTTMKTPRPPGAWAATPAPARSQTPQPASSSFASTKLSRARSNSLPQSSVTDIQPSSALSRAGTLPVRTPAPPGGWFPTPGSLRRKGLMKVRFETATSDSAVSDADTGAKKDGKLEAPLPEADWDATSLPGPGLNASESMSEPSFNDVESSSPAPAPPVSASNDGEEEGGSAANAPPETTGNPSTHTGSPPRRKSRRSSSVRLVDEYGHDVREDPPITPSRKDVREHSASMRMPGGGSLKTPRSTSVRMVDAMGHEIDEPSEQNDSEDTVTELRYSRQEALQRMKRAVADLREGLSSVDSAGKADLDDPRLSELYDLSKAARDMRAQLASSLQQAQSSQLRHKYGSLKESMRRSRFLPNFLPEPRAVPWNHWLFWTFFCFLQFVLFLVMYRMSRTHARHQFLTTYFDPFYADLHLHPNKPDYNYDTNLFSFFRRPSLEPSYPELLGIDGPIQYIRRNIAHAVARVQRSMWESWGASGDDRVKAWPPT